MKKGDLLYQKYLDILAEELRPAMGCTEPIALAYAGAKARQLLGALPDRVDIGVSGNIIKNVKSVIVPIPAASTVSARRFAPVSSAVTRIRSWKSSAPLQTASGRN